MSDPMKMEIGDMVVTSDDVTWPGRWLRVTKTCRSCGHVGTCVIHRSDDPNLLACGKCGASADPRAETSRP